MNFLVLDEVPSWQQKVYRLQIQMEGDAFLKKIVTDYSWWTLDECDVYQRETVSHMLMTELMGFTLLLQTDDNKREFITKALPNPEVTKDNVESYADAILDTLALMRNRRNTALDRLTPSVLSDLFSQKATQANVKAHLIDEFCSFVQSWERTFGSEICFVHGDFHPGNILQAEDGTFYPFDFEEAIESLPAFDGANISHEIHRRCGEAAYEYFKSRYQRRFGEPLIDWRDWGRFRHLRGWIARCYLEQCCDARTMELAKAFIEGHEPETVDAKAEPEF